MSDLYATLGVSRRAKPATIEKAYRRRAKDTHPDRNPGDPTAADRFQAVETAYRVLSDPACRARYDATGDATPPRPDESAHHAARVLGWALAQALRGLAEHNLDATRQDVVRLMGEAIRRQLDEAGKERKRLERARADLAAVADRVTADGPDNLVADVARAHMGQIDATLAQMAAEAGHFERAAAELKRYKYRFEGPIFQPGSWRGTWAATATSTSW